MKWGETQNLLSVIVGLNFAYYAFKELREPFVATVKNKIDDLQAAISNELEGLNCEREYNRPSQIPESFKISGEFSKVELEVSELRGEIASFDAVTSGRRFDYLFGMPAMTVGVLGIIALVFSTIKFEDELSICLFYAFVIIGFLPVAIVLVVNYLLVWITVRKFETKYHILHRTYYALFVDRILDHHLTIAKAKFELGRKERSSDPRAG